MLKSRTIASQVSAYTTCSAGLLAGLEEYGRSRGLDVKAHAETLGLNPKCFGQLDQRVPVKDVNDLLTSLQEETGDSSIGLKFGESFPLGHSGLIGMAMLNAPSAGEMLRFYAQFHDLTIEQSMNTILVEGDLYANYNLTSPLIGDIHLFEDFISVLFIRHLRHHTGENWAPVKIAMQSPKPNDTTDWDRIFRCPIDFGAPVACTYYGKSINDYRNPDANIKLFEFLRHEISEKYKEHLSNLPLIARAQRAISARMLIGDCTINKVARDLGFSERSFQRKLAENGVTFMQISHEVKRAVFYLSLAQKDKNLEEVAQICGYDTVSSFSRAVKTLLNKTPTELRKEIFEETGSASRRVRNVA